MTKIDDPCVTCPACGHRWPAFEPFPSAGLADRVGTMRDVLVELGSAPEGMQALAEHYVCDGGWRADSCGEDADYIDEGSPVCEAHSRDASEGYDVRSLTEAELAQISAANRQMAKELSVSANEINGEYDGGYDGEVENGTARSGEAWG